MRIGVTTPRINTVR